MKANKIAVIVCSFLLILIIKASVVFPCQVQEIIDSLQERYNKTFDITASFKQTTFTLGDPNGINATGRVYFKRPHLMRWDYKEPEEQLIVTSDKNVYLYEKEAEQVSVLSRDRFLSSKLSRAFFFGKGDIRRDFFVDECKENNQLLELKLRPKTKIPQLRVLFLFVDPKSFLVKKTILEDQMGGKTIIEFLNIKVNKGLSNELFHFKPPKGVEVFKIE